MKRKTNLFYTDGADSRFITFSNYTESLTGNFLSTDTKLFPSRFICLNIPVLNNAEGITDTLKKQMLIKYIASYYESKMAVLRDNCELNNTTAENKLLPLNYILEALMHIEDIQSDKVIYNTDNQNYIFDIVYISDITEQDYNGTYTDTICMVDLNNWKSGEIICDTLTEQHDIVIDIPVHNETPCLYGWEDGIIPDIYAGEKSIFDNINEIEKKGIYTLSSKLNNIKFNNVNDKTELTFNVIIPLFDVTDINYNSNFTHIIEESSISLVNEINNNLYTKNIPLGMWFSDEPVTLKKDISTGFAQSWSLLISSQFKPFPYAKTMPNEVVQSSKSNAFATFAQVLSRQNDIIDKFNEISNQINGIYSRIEAVESALRNIGTSANIDKVHTEQLNYENAINKKMDAFKKEILDYLNDIKWKSVI